MLKILLILAATLVLGGCSSTSSEFILGSRDCGYIGCETGNLEFYPNEPLGAQLQPRRVCGFEWGQSSSAYHPSTEEYKILRQQEVARWNGEGVMDQCLQ